MSTMTPFRMSSLASVFVVYIPDTSRNHMNDLDASFSCGILGMDHRKTPSSSGAGLLEHSLALKLHTSGPYSLLTLLAILPSSQLTKSKNGTPR